MISILNSPQFYIFLKTTQTRASSYIIYHIEANIAILLQITMKKLGWVLFMRLLQVEYIELRSFWDFAANPRKIYAAGSTS